MMERETEHLDPEDRRILGLEATSPPEKRLTFSERVGRAFGAAILAMVGATLLALLAMGCARLLMIGWEGMFR